MPDQTAEAVDGDTDGGAESRVDDYEEMLEVLDVAIGEAREKVENGRVYDAENERVRTKWIRTLAYVVNVRRQVTADRDLEELREEIEALKEQQEEDDEGEDD